MNALEEKWKIIVGYYILSKAAIYFCCLLHGKKIRKANNIKQALE